MITCDQSHDLQVELAESKQFAVLNDVHRMFVIARHPDEHANFVKQRSKRQHYSGTSVEVMVRLQSVEQLFCQNRDMLRMSFVEPVSGAEVNGGTDHMIPEVAAPDVVAGQFLQQAVPQVHIGESNLIDVESLRHVDDCEQRRDQSFGIWKRQVIIVDEFVD